MTNLSAINVTLFGRATGTYLAFKHLNMCLLPKIKQCFNNKSQKQQQLFN